ncbi:MAG: GNAT family N-acetyltransferase [Planctomycetaceae bacterium]
MSRVFLREGISGELVAADLFDSILDNHLEDHEQYWKPLLAAQLVEHGHWNWRRKMEYYASQLSYQSFALEYSGRTQGLMIVNTTRRCRIPTQANRHLVYVEYLEAAPWNRGSTPLLKGVGTVLIAAAIQLSRDEGNHGRIGLHSLPQADAFYRDRCGMTDLGPDVAYSSSFPLRYFEMTESQAANYLNGSN